MRTIILFITAALLMSNSLSAQTETAKTKTKRDTSKKEVVKQEIIINDSWSSTKKTPFKKRKPRKTRTRQTVIGIGNSSLRIREKSDTTFIGLGNHELIISERNGNSRVYLKNKRRERRRRSFVGHWTGFEIGIASFKEDMKDAPEGFMELTYPKTTAVNLNLLQGNFKLIGSRFGLVSGLGLSWYNFRFKDDITLIDIKNEAGKSITTQATIMDTYPKRKSGVKKSKLTICYLTVPLLLEVQGRNKDMYISAGLIGGLRIGSHTKIKFKDGGKEKDFGDFNLLPYKLDATVRMGFNIFSLWASYSLTPLFQKDKLYNNVENKYETKTPVAIGLSFNLF
jgi:hypothetical protein